MEAATLVCLIGLLILIGLSRIDISDLQNEVSRLRNELNKLK